MRSVKQKNYTGNWPAMEISKNAHQFNEQGAQQIYKNLKQLTNMHKTQIYLRLILLCQASTLCFCQKQYVLREFNY